MRSTRTATSKSLRRLLLPQDLFIVIAIFLTGEFLYEALYNINWISSVMFLGNNLHSILSIETPLSTFDLVSFTTLFNVISIVPDILTWQTKILSIVYVFMITFNAKLSTLIGLSFAFDFNQLRVWELSTGVLRLYRRFLQLQVYSTILLSITQRRLLPRLLILLQDLRRHLPLRCRSLLRFLRRPWHLHLRRHPSLPRLLLRCRSYRILCQPLLRKHRATTARTTNRPLYKRRGIYRRSRRSTLYVTGLYRHIEGWP